MLLGTEPRVDWVELFGRRGPVEIDVGCGKGGFLIDAAREQPSVNFLGIEIQGRLVRHIQERIDRHGLANARILHADAAFALHWVPDATVARVHVYFPDPWWKRKHHKRRLVQDEFVSTLARILGPEGELHLATDVAFRFDEMLAHLEGFRVAERRSGPSERAVCTNFERKYRAQGREMHYALLRPETRSQAPAQKPS